MQRGGLLERIGGGGAEGGRRGGDRGLRFVHFLAKCGSFSAVSAPSYATKYCTKYTFFSMFVYLQDYLTESLKFCNV